VALLLLFLMLAPAASALVVHTDKPPTTPPPEPVLRGPPGPDLTGLAPKWCGTPTTVDEYRSNRSNLPHVKVVYAYAADAPNRFAQYADVIQDGLHTASAVVAQDSGGRRALRFDAGTPCGKGVLDIMVVRLPQPRAHYAVANPTDALKDDVRRRLRAPRDLRRKILIMADGIRHPDGPGGLAWSQDDARPGPENDGNEGYDGNAGNGFAVIYGNGEPAFVENQPYLVNASLHEVMHLLGAVPSSAPNGTPGLHCRDEWDLMCYEDGPGVTLGFPCQGDFYTTRLDCGSDDYFSVNPPRGAWLDRHWNVFDSYFLCVPAECGAPVAVRRLRASGTTRGLTVRYRLSQSLPVSFVLERRTARGRWLALSGWIHHGGVAGENVVRRPRRLAAGRYRVRAITGERGPGQPRSARTEFTVG
jgi:hypothetical protein